MRKILITLLVTFFFCSLCYAQTIITLKSGKTVQGTLVEQNEQYIKINFEDIDITYWLDEVESIQLPDGTKLTPSAKAQAPEPLTSQTPEAALTTVVESREALQNPSAAENTDEMAVRRLRSGTQVGLGVLIVLIGIILLFGVGSYIFLSLCLVKIAEKTNTPNGWFAWVPIMNLLLMCDIAQKPRWWAALFALGLIPYIGWLISAAISVILLMKICERMGKPSWWGIITIVPLASFVIFGMLAFGKEADANIVPFQPITDIPPQPPKENNPTEEPKGDTITREGFS